MDQSQLANQPPMDFGGEVLRSFGWLSENAKVNDQIIKRAIERAKRSAPGQ